MISGYSSASFDIVDSYFVNDETAVIPQPESPPTFQDFQLSDDFYYAALAQVFDDLGYMG